MSRTFPIRDRPCRRPTCSEKPAISRFGLKHIRSASHRADHRQASRRNRSLATNGDRLEDESVVEYEHLVLATQRRNRPAVPVPISPTCFCSARSMKASALRERMASAKNIVVSGSGLYRPGVRCDRYKDPDQMSPCWMWLIGRWLARCRKRCQLYSRASMRRPA